MEGEPTFSQDEAVTSSAMNPRTVVFGLLLLLLAAIYFFYMPQ